MKLHHHNTLHHRTIIEEIEKTTEDEVTEPEQVVDHKDIDSTNAALGEYAKRYVPEGMVLPAGSEDEMDVSASKMKMPKFDGKISLERKEKPIERPIEKPIESPIEKPKKKNAGASSRKDDFDIAFTPGDDFDI